MLGLPLQVFGPDCWKILNYQQFGPCRTLSPSDDTAANYHSCTAKIFWDETRELPAVTVHSYFSCPGQQQAPALPFLKQSQIQNPVSSSGLH